MRKPLLILIGILLATGSARAIVVADYSIATNTPTGSWNVNWDYVYRYKGSSAVAVGSHWLLTAAHVADDITVSNIVVDGITYYQKEIIFHSIADDSSHTNRADLALVRFDKEFPGYYPLYTGTFPTSPTKKLNAVLVGYGTTGTVSALTYTARAWNDSPNGAGVKRWGSQKIDLAVANLNYDVGGTTGWTYNDGIYMGFNSSDTAYEAGVGTYDSGGGSFVNDGGTWKLAVINTLQNGADPNYTGVLGVSIPAYATWATNVMNPTGDLDGDGIPNYWEQQYGTTTGLTAFADSDSDGYINEDEYIADTNPTNASSFFENTGLLTLDNQTFYFNGSTARQYQVFYTTNDLADPALTWLEAHTNKVWGTGTNTSITVTNTDDTVFYRLRVSLP